MLIEDNTKEVKERLSVDFSVLVSNIYQSDHTADLLLTAIVVLYELGKMAQQIVCLSVLGSFWDVFIVNSLSAMVPRALFDQR